MPAQGASRPPLACRWLIGAASWIVPRRLRPEWRARWNAGLRDWWILTERGALVDAGWAPAVRQWSAALAAAFWLRFERERLLRWVRGPSFVLRGAAATLALLGAFTGFQKTRELLAMAQRAHQAAPDAVVVHAFAIVFALAIGLALVAIGRLSLRGYGWRWWAFLAFKTTAVLAILTLLWVEAGAELRTHISNGPLRILLGGVVFTLAFVVAFGWALLWSFADQRRRCPVCLQRLALPVTIGSWASIFEPVSTELLCEEGHGSLCLPETDAGEPDRWTALDPSWRELFEKNTRA